MTRIFHSTFRAIIITIAGIFAFTEDASAQTSEGKISGVIIDEITESPVKNASVQVLGTTVTAITNDKGEFSFDNLKFDTYRIRISSAGYEPVIKSDLMLYASRKLELLIKLTPKEIQSNIQTEVIDVEGNYFGKSSDINLSVMNLDYEEIRRAPGATEDISRMLQTAPGVAIGNDQRNDIIIRGGSPSENLILIDGIEIPNINHFGTDGSSSGAIGFINSKFIRETNMLTGGFPSIYGDKLSGVVDITFREGAKKFYKDINLSIAGFGGIIEGPLSDEGSYMISARRSYLELIRSAIRLTSVPNYWDFNLKVNYNLSPKDKITVIGLLGLDKIDFSGGDAVDNPYGNSSDDQKTLGAGINYKKLFRNGYLENVVSNSYTDTKIVQVESEGNSNKFKYFATTNEVTIKSTLNNQLSRSIFLSGGIGGKIVGIKSEMYLKGDTNAAGYVYDTINARSDINTHKLFGHVNFTSKFFNNRLIFNTGFRLDYFDYIKNKTYFSPRAGVSYSVSDLTSFNLAWGIYFQSPEYVWLVSSPQNNLLNSIRCEHYIAGIDHYFASDIKATVELYHKEYNGYPVWKDVPTYILIDGGSDFGPNIVGEASSAGYGTVNGIDLSIQKKLSSSGLYGMLTYSYIHSGFTALEGGKKPGAFDPGHQFTLIAGYQFTNGWLAGIKFKYSGGRPYTPIDESASYLVNRAVFATNDFNSERYPHYMRVDVRVDKKFDFRNASLIAYLELQNIFDRENVYSYYWNEDYRKLSTIYQWAFFPVGGISVQF